MSMSGGRMSAPGIIGVASNIRTGSNPLFTFEDFIAVYPQFGANADGNYVIPQMIIQMFIDLANECINQARWHSYWTVAMGWFVAHFCTLYMQGTADPNSGAAGVLKAGQTRGLATSKSAGDVSVSTDYSVIAQDLDGWAAWKLTIYGQQLATIGRLVGKGGMYIY
ncbi:DUF4054 domain-containing protein [Brevibacillus laterosporus]|uniref:DUF4054 domain-containing protein n=1 Tax=Brevibacillus laterosporus TaxID=1465 RepID=A0AAP3DJ38_BRELA|nr:DUF4054 domain-containing protein [Brevibacillus laterosporus]MCR8981641.1 DUF4054 domain-containing protein [Brevibacillus laterosporus]MCZ0808796.1 DUF4054 domain-containing protein [Brevibacillus laterosporus]MCZ0827231.1 DUF4054 domain-containing protein [Brevibacillus laterosporus]MCZ0850987.1 DUF4054 domain-containing protein [Brevibacillus laterosporus]